MLILFLEAIGEVKGWFEKLAILSSISFILSEVPTVISS
jgi:hypothetical protein